MIATLWLVEYDKAEAVKESPFMIMSRTLVSETTA